MSQRLMIFAFLVPIVSVCLFIRSAAAASDYDGPAQLPIATVASSMAETPAPGSIINVNAGDDLQASLNTVQCGSTIRLQAGATFTGTFKFPALNCDDNHWIIVRTSSPCCPRAASGHAAVAPPSSVMNFRRVIRSPHRRGRAASAALRGRVPWPF